MFHQILFEANIVVGYTFKKWLITSIYLIIAFFTIVYNDYTKIRKIGMAWLGLWILVSVIYLLT